MNPVSLLPHLVYSLFRIPWSFFKWHMFLNRQLKFAAVVSDIDLLRLLRPDWCSEHVRGYKNKIFIQTFRM